VTYVVQRGGGSVSSALTLGNGWGMRWCRWCDMWEVLLPGESFGALSASGALAGGDGGGAVVIVGGVTAVAVGQWRKRRWAAVGGCGLRGCSCR